MKIEFIDVSCGGRFTHVDPEQLIRFYDFNNLQADILQQTIQKVIVENNKEIDLTTLDFIQAVNCSLILKISNTDTGITTSGNDHFVCSLAVQKYKEMIHLIEPFCSEGTTGYQWLYDLDTPIDLLFSPGGTW